LALLERLSDPLVVLLPFQVPVAEGAIVLPEGGRAVVYRYLAGRPLHPGDLGPGPGLAANLGKALAALHETPASVLEGVGMPVYSAAEYRDRRLAEVDAAAATSHVPSTLLSRWEKCLEDVARWKFHTTVTHGDLVAEHVLAEGDAVVGILDWSDAKVADPADDLAWIAVGSDESALDAVLEAYSLARAAHPDRHLAVRARLAGELALARWLLHGVRQDSAEIVDDAIEMLEDLAADVGDATL
jgi:aminoglycoside phosphotransferase (APT) family kinase protein